MTVPTYIYGDPLLLSRRCASVPSVARRWRQEAIRWVDWKRATYGHYEGRNGQEAVRFLTRVGLWLEATGEPRSPRTFSESDALRVARQFGSAPKTKRWYLGLLGSFLKSRGNDAVQRSGILSTLSRDVSRRRWLAPEELERLMDRAVGLERLVVALEGFQGLRRIEVLRCRVSDFDAAGGLWVRGKRHRGEPSRWVPTSERVRREVAWYLPLRRRWAETATDVPELLAWADSGRLRAYSIGSIDRMVRSAGRRAGLAVVSNHDLRRTFVRVLRNRGADWREIAGLVGHRSISETEHYAGQERDRLESAIALLTGAKA